MPVTVKSEPDMEIQSSNVSSTHGGNDGSDDHDGNDDEIVREIDVYLSPALASQMYLMQFPLQHQTLSEVKEARIKKRHCMIELDHTIPDEIAHSGQYYMEKRTYSSHTVPVSTHMAIGKLVPNASYIGRNNDSNRQRHDLHLIPLSRIAQMRPNFDHVDEADINATTAEEESESNMVERAEASAKLERKPLAFQKKESERNRLARKSSYAYKRASEEGEPWQALSVHPTNSVESSECKDIALCESPNNNLVVFPEPGSNSDVTMSAAGKDEGATLNGTYVHSLNYLPNSDKLVDKRDVMDDQTVCTKLVRLLRKGMPVPYSLLRCHFPATVPDETIVRALRSCAFLIRGNFVLQSRLLSLSPALAQVRTFVLFVLQTVGYVSRGRLDYAFKDSENGENNSAAVLMILEQVAQKKSDGWKLKVEDDTNFVSQHPESVQTFLQFWGDQVQRFGQLLERYRSDDWVLTIGGIEYSSTV